MFITHFFLIKSLKKQKTTDSNIISTFLFSFWTRLYKNAKKYLRIPLLMEILQDLVSFSPNWSHCPHQRGSLIFFESCINIVRMVFIFNDLFGPLSQLLVCIYALYFCSDFLSRHIYYSWYVIVSLVEICFNNIESTLPEFCRNNSTYCDYLRFTLFVSNLVQGIMLNFC